MPKTTPKQNKALVLEVFDTLFNKRDYTAEERFWPPQYIQYSAHIAAGRDGLFALIRSVPQTLRYENQLIAAEQVRRWLGRYLAVGTASAILFLISRLSALAAGPQGFSIKVITSLDDQFWTNSVIIEGSREVMLVDAQLTKTNAERVLQEIAKTHKPLSILYITHEHADHFLGLEVFKKAYPKVRVIATSAVVERIAKVYQEKLAKWKQLLGSGATEHVVAIGQFDGPVINFENSQIAVLKKLQGDTNENTMLWIPAQRLLIAGDVVFNNMHVYTAETDSNARGRWLNSLKTIRELHPSIVVPGHSKVGAPLDASTAVDFTESYLLAFEKELTEAKDPDGLINAMKKRFPTADLLLALERGAIANFKF